MIYVVASPIGNLKDITLRAIDILKEVDFILAEDTRRTKILLNNLGIEKEIISYHKFNEKEKTEKIKILLEKNKKVALISDAGTPCISDPGYFIIDYAIKNNIKVIPIPGASSLTSILSVSGFSYKDRKISFLGFLPHQKGKKEKIIEQEIENGNISVFFDSPNRITETLEIIKNISEDIEVVIGRELTKIYEEIIKFKINNIPEITFKGEFVVVLNSPILKHKDIEFKNLNANKIAYILSKYLNISKDKAYKELVKLKENF